MKFHKIFTEEVLKIYFQKTALHLAVEKESLDIINLLLSYDGIEINIIDDVLKII